MKAKRIIPAAVLCAWVLTQTAVFGQKTSSVYYYPDKSACIEYAYTGSTTGTETWYMDNNGKLTARYSELTTKSFGSTSKTSQVTIQRDSVFYTINLLNKTGVKQTVHYDQKDLDKWSKNSQEAWTDMGFKKIGEEDILGKHCEIWEGMSTKSWIWKNYVLKTVSDLFDKTTIEAKKIETGIAVDRSKFEVPDGIKMEEYTLNASDPVFDSLGKDLQKGLNDLKDMFAPKKKKQ